MNRDMLYRPLREAIVTMMAALITMSCALAIDPEPGPAILAIVLCLSLSRSQLDRDLRGRLEAAITLPAVSLAALGVGMLLLHARWFGAAAFVSGISLSIWLRRFGPLIRRAGSLIALPFVVILTTPYVPTTRVGHAMALLLPIIVALLALFWVTVFHLLARQLRWLPPAYSKKLLVSPPKRESSTRPIPSTRMAIQMATALSVAFLIGYVFFAERWSWIVLTTFIVGSGNQGRLDVAYKSVLRVLGAAAGTVLAMVLTAHMGSHDATTVVLILAAVFLGIWLRPLGYAWWALFVTLALSLLQGFEGTSTQQILWPRLEEIVIGAIIGVAAAWFVLPVRSTAVLRRRIADALEVLADALNPETPQRMPDAFDAALADVEKVAAAFRASRWLTHRVRALQPADWVDALLICRVPALALFETGAAPGRVRRALGVARKSIREPETLLLALVDLRRSMLEQRAPETESG